MGCPSDNTEEEQNFRFTTIETYTAITDVQLLNSETLEYMQSFEYDSEGNLVSQTCYNREGGFDFKETYEYDSSGKRTKKSHYRPEDTLQRYTLYEYNNGHGRLTRRTSFDGQTDEIMSYVEYEYNDEGACVTEEYWIPDEPEPDLYFLVNYYYNAQGQLIIKECIDVGWGDSECYFFEYDADKNCIAVHLYFADYYVVAGLQAQYSNVISQQYEYDENDRLTKATMKEGSDDIINECVFEYDENGCLTKVAEYMTRFTDNAAAVQERYRYSKIKWEEQPTRATVWNWCWWPKLDSYEWWDDEPPIIIVSNPLDKK
jgi:hypothetical protein